MNRQQILKWIKDPASLNSESLADLRQIISDYPYFQTTRLLYLLNLKILEDYRFEQELRKLSVYVPDRARLREWVRSMEAKTGQEADKPGQKELPEIHDSKDLQATERMRSLEKEIKINLNEIEQKKRQLKKLLEEKKAMVGGDKTGLEDFYSTSSDSSLRPLPKDELLEDFLKTHTQKVSQDKSRYSPEDAARKSIEENYGVLSETLARLVAAQGKKEEAVKIYQQLMLKNPQKSSYFAAQIEKLRKEP